MKHIKLFEGFLNEGSYDDFLDNYHDELKEAIVKLSALGKVYDEIDEKIGEEIEKKLSVYDKNVSKRIMDWIVASVHRPIRKNDIADFALDNMNKYGTEMQMVLNAIDDYYDVVGKFVPVEASKIRSNHVKLRNEHVKEMKKMLDGKDAVSESNDIEKVKKELQEQIENVISNFKRKMDPEDIFDVLDLLANQQKNEF